MGKRDAGSDAPAWVFLLLCSKAWGVTLTKQGQDAILKTERALLLAVGSLVSHYVNNADRSVAAERSACFYGKCHSQDDHEHQKFQKKFSHSSLTPFQKDFAWGEELTAIVRNNASFRPF